MKGDVFEVQEKTISPHVLHPTYPLLPGDILVEQEDGTFTKTAPGLGLGGFVLTDEQRAALKPLESHPRIEIVSWDEFLSP